MPTLVGAAIFLAFVVGVTIWGLTPDILIPIWLGTIWTLTGCFAMIYVAVRESH